MTTILVSALLSQGGQVLLARRHDGVWELPSEPLGDAEETDDALVRVLRTHLGLGACAFDFLDTYYERAQTDMAPIVRNVYRVEAAAQPPRLHTTERYSELRWTSPLDLGAFGASESLRCVLRDGVTSPMGEETPPGAPIIVLTGPAAAGKSTIAGALCVRLERAAHIEVDLLRDMVVAGYASPIPGLGDPIGAAAQADLAIANAASLAHNFSLAGYAVVIDDVLQTVEALDRLLEALKGIAEVSLFTLLPTEETLISRDGLRDPDLQMGMRCLELRSILQSNGETRGLRLDNSDMTPNQAAEWILDRRDLARVALVPRPQHWDTDAAKD